LNVLDVLSLECLNTVQSIGVLKLLVLGWLTAIWNLRVLVGDRLLLLLLIPIGVRERFILELLTAIRHLRILINRVDCSVILRGVEVSRALLLLLLLLLLIIVEGRHLRVKLLLLNLIVRLLTELRLSLSER